MKTTGTIKIEATDPATLDVVMKTWGPKVTWSPIIVSDGGVTVEGVPEPTEGGPEVFGTATLTITATINP